MTPVLPCSTLTGPIDQDLQDLQTKQKCTLLMCLFFLALHRWWKGSSERKKVQPTPLPDYDQIMIFRESDQRLLDKNIFLVKQKYH